MSRSRNVSSKQVKSLSSVPTKPIFFCESAICWSKGKYFKQYSKHSFRKFDKFVEIWHLVYINTGLVWNLGHINVFLGLWAQLFKENLGTRCLAIKLEGIQSLRREVCKLAIAKGKGANWLLICEVKHHVLAAIQRGAIPGSTKPDKAWFDTRCRWSDIAQPNAFLLFISCAFFAFLSCSFGRYAGDFFQYYLEGLTNTVPYQLDLLLYYNYSLVVKFEVIWKNLELNWSVPLTYRSSPKHISMLVYIFGLNVPVA